ncbi:MAG: winged helix-turn-helix transcriptional regulator, partial [Planctomycetes bacterium]|nr:winged helix-turn-helix transcriptional regulator [Planctomycetota bacterium]
MTTEAIAGPQAQIQARRASAERLLDYADHLDASDRALLRAVFDRGLTSTDLAEVIGQEPRAVRRRVQRLVERIGSAS